MLQTQNDNILLLSVPTVLVVSSSLSHVRVLVGLVDGDESGFLNQFQLQWCL